MNIAVGDIPMLVNYPENLEYPFITRKLLTFSHSNISLPFSSARFRKLK